MESSCIEDNRECLVLSMALKLNNCQCVEQEMKKEISSSPPQYYYMYVLHCQRGCFQTEVPVADTGGGGRRANWVLPPPREIEVKYS